MDPIDYNLLQAAASTLKERWPEARPQIGFILGSGWGAAVEALTIKDSLSYSEIPGMGATGVAGHSGLVSLAEYQGREMLIFQGRRHAYEGVGWTPIALPVYTMRELGAETLLVTNAAGGLREDLSPGTLMLIEDHINLIGMTPLIGKHNEFWGERFLDLTQAYDAKLQGLLEKAASNVKEDLRKGVYCAAFGPCYETPAEVRMLKTLGVDAVGMSTVPSTILGNACGMRVLGISCITNFAAGIGKDPLTHDEVMQASKEAMGRIQALLLEFLKLYE